MQQYVPVVLIFALALLVSVVIPILSRLLGPPRPTPSKQSVYECGITPVGSARDRFSVKFYLVAILFIIFDIEIVFMYPWAVVFKKGIQNGEGWYLFAVMAVFFLVLTLGLIFELKKGALDWNVRSPAQKK